MNENLKTKRLCVGGACFALALVIVFVAAFMSMLSQNIPLSVPDFNICINCHDGSRRGIDTIGKEPMPAGASCGHCHIPRSRWKG